MEIPIGVSHHSFWNITKSKGIKINSKFTGVYFNVNGKAPSWMARVQGKGKWKRFEFTEKGEIEASKFYNRYVIKNP